MQIGDTVILKSSIWDDGEDHHPPGWIAFKNESVVVKKILNDGSLIVAHVGNPGGFRIYQEEYTIGE